MPQVHTASVCEVGQVVVPQRLQQNQVLQEVLPWHGQVQSRMLQVLQLDTQGRQ